MSKIVNLRHTRKQRDRAAKKADAAANASLNGRTKADRAAEEQAAKTARKHLDDHKRDET